MIKYMNNGPVITVADPLRQGEYKSYPNPEWQGMPEIISFTDFLRWNYTAEYGRYIRDQFYEQTLPLPYGISYEAGLDNVTIASGRYDRIDSYAFIMYVICDVGFDCEGIIVHQDYCVSGYFRTYGSSLFCESVDIYNGERIRCHNPLDEYLVPVMSKRDFDSIAAEMLDRYYTKEIGYVYKIDGRALATAMGYNILFKRLSLNGKIKSKLIFDRKDVTIYDQNGVSVSMIIPENTILVDISMFEDDKLDNVIIHECVHAYLHHIFYSAQSMYRKGIGKEMPEFQDYFYSSSQQDCIRWMETQANSIASHIQMPRDITTDVIIDFIDQYDDDMSFGDYRELIDYVKFKFGVSRYAAKKRIIELGWKEVRGVYAYCTTGYVEDHEVEENLPLDCTYTVPLKCIARIFGTSQDFASLVCSKRYIYIDGHMCRNDDKYIIRDSGANFGLTYYARHHMAECCVNFKRVYGKQEYSYTYGELNKEELKAIVEHTLNMEQKNKLKQALIEQDTERLRLANNATVNPLGEAVKFHMKRCKVTVEALAERSGLGISTIEKMRYGKKVKLETILAFSVALELEKSFMYDLMNKANVCFDTRNPAHNMYLAILELIPNANVFQINDILKEEGFTPWTQERESKTNKKTA